MWRGNQYYINRMSMPMEDARHFCQQRHGDLVSITSKDENTFIWKQVSVFFFGLFNSSHKFGTMLQKQVLTPVCISQISRSYGNYYIGLSVDLDGSFWWVSAIIRKYATVGYIVRGEQRRLLGLSRIIISDTEVRASLPSVTRRNSKWNWIHRQGSAVHYPG